MSRMRSGLLGMSGAGEELLATLRAHQEVELVAVADRDRSLAASATEDAPEISYDDHRQLIVESAANGLEALFVALPVFEVEDYLPLAADRGLGVLVVPPFARRFDTAVELVQRFTRGACPLVIARTWNMPEPATDGGRADSSPGRFYSAHGRVVEKVGESLGWRGDSHQAGGGALLHAGYELIDAVVTLMGVPDSVFCAAGLTSPEGSVRTYDTEDAAALSFGYADDRVAALTCERAAVHSAWDLELTGEQGPVAVSRTNAGGADRFGPAVTALARGLSAESTVLESQAGAHLGTLATISTAYLSVRTGQVESPHKFLELAADRHR